MSRYKCKICGRDKFQKPTPHNCGSNFLKHYGRKKYKDKYMVACLDRYCSCVMCNRMCFVVGSNVDNVKSF